MLQPRKFKSLSEFESFMAKNRNLNHFKQLFHPSTWEITNSTYFAREGGS